MSQDSNFSDPNIAQIPSDEPPLNAPQEPLPSDSPATGVDSDGVETSSVATPPAPADDPSTAAPDATNASPHETSLVPVPPPQPPAYPNQQPQAQQQPGPPVHVKARNPLLYAAVDLLITGLGLMLQGRVGLGIMFLGINVVTSLLLFIPFLGWVLFFLVLIPVWIISMAMAFSTAKKWNRQHGIIS